MKKIFKLAAIAVSMALVTSLVACSSGDDDVVDTTTPEYLLNAQIGKYVASINYNQNVSDDEIDDLKDAHKAVMDSIDGCASCLAVYLNQLISKFGNDPSNSENEVTSEQIDGNIKALGELKSYGKDDYHDVFVYKPALVKALADVQKAKSKVVAIGAPDGDTIIDGKLNDRQASNMNAYIDAFAALKATLNKVHSEKYKKDFESVDGEGGTFAKFNDLNKDVGEKELGNVNYTRIEDVIEDVDVVYDMISTNVCNTIVDKYNGKYVVSVK